MLPRLGLHLCLLLIAATAAAHGTHQARLAEADRRIAEAPGNPDHYRARSVLHREHGDLEAALADLDKAQALDPGRPLDGLLRGRAELARGRPAAARAALEGTLAVWPDHPEVHRTLARARSAEGDAAGAAHHHERALAATPVATPTHHLERARALAAADRSEEALAALDEGIAHLGPHPALIEAAVAIELERGRPDAALARLDHGPQPAGAPSLLRRGQILEQAGRPREAIVAYRGALAELASRRRQTPAGRALASRAQSALERLEP